MEEEYFLKRQQRLDELNRKPIITFTEEDHKDLSRISYEVNLEFFERKKQQWQRNL